MTFAMQGAFWIPERATADFKKSDPPKTGPAFGNWAGRDLHTLTLPGGGLLQFDLSRLTLADFRTMRDHYQVNASLTVLQFMMHRMDWHIECKDKKIAAYIEGNVREVWTRMIRALSQSFWAGFSPIAVEYINNPNGRDGTGSLDINKFKDLLPEECTVNWKDVEGYAPPGRIKPKFRVYDGIKQWGQQWPVPVDNSLWYPLLMENGDYYGKKLLRPAFSSWYFSILVHLWANRYFERFGEPVPIGRAPYDDDVKINDVTVSGRAAMEQILVNLRNRAVVVLPSDREQTGPGTSDYSYDIQYLESQMRGADFEAYLSRLDEEITLGLFTPLLLLKGTDHGNGNLGVQQMQMYLWMLNALAGDMKEYIDNYVIDRLKSFNFGPNAPKAYWVYRDMGKESVETIRVMMQELLRKDKIMPDLEQLSQAAGVDVKAVKVLTAPPPAPVDPNAPVVDPNAPVVDPNAPVTAKPADTRIRNRDDRNRGSKGPRGVGSPRATGRSIAARIQSTVENAFKRDRDLPELKMGYRKQLVDDLADDLGYEAAFSAVERIFRVMNNWLDDARGMDYENSDDFMAHFNALLEEQLDRVE